MNMFNKLPYFVKLKGKKYEINVDFRNMISFEMKVEDKKLDKSKKIEYGLRNFYPAFFHNENYNELLTDEVLYKEACEKLIWFYKSGREDYHQISKSSSKQTNQIYSYNYDDEYIYGAFYEQYKIDLSEDRLHWWKFKAMLKSLKDDTEFVKIKGHRAYSGNDKRMVELKNYWALPLQLEEKQRLNKIYETLK